METYSPQTLPWIPIALLGGGFLAAVILGSLAWFNSKRPAGWENAERPSYIPKMGDESGKPPSEDGSS